MFLINYRFLHVYEEFHILSHSCFFFASSFTNYDFSHFVFYFKSSQLLWNRAGRSKSMLVTQSCSTFCDPMDCSPPDSSVHRILQTKILEWVAISFFKFCHQRIRLFYNFFSHNITIVLQYNHRKGILGVVSFTLC